jgi:hypothetical protein
MLDELPAEATVCHRGNTRAHLPIILEGQPRVSRISENGREISYIGLPGEKAPY